MRFIYACRLHVHLRATVFTLNAAFDLVAMIRNIHGSNILLVSNFEEYYSI